MADTEQLRKVIEDLIEVLHLEAKEVERVTTHLEQQTVRMDRPTQLPLVVSELSELHNRIKKME